MRRLDLVDLAQLDREAIERPPMRVEVKRTRSSRTGLRESMLNELPTQEEGLHVSGFRRVLQLQQLTS